ncbi:cytochrome P450 [Coniophora puteana RWD-64-598 SS2]|uniref:Cytochrome P450 n=1 Tax=Coniophora puteana (strain RWD-64-598) TaxID=741705 RepID=R7SCW5_CONPW|nr:cytochrome P450 [Coniophora puteana RWD-64-598 SS2]EIW74016.1 cytochrome P450 [Coniophora puteana RWD-64-598 SS2]
MSQPKVAAGKASHFVASDELSKFRDTENPDEIVEDIAYAGQPGEETTAATLTIFVLVMTLYPEVQARAQAEIDDVAGPDRLPDFDGHASMPYVEAVYRETLRWKPIAPIPQRKLICVAGALIIPNVWAMSQNTDRYPSPSSFDPSRFLDGDGNLVGGEPSYVFGFGRRIRPGRHFANASLWPAMICVLGRFRIEKVKDVAVDDIEPNPEWTVGLTT